MRLKQTLSRVPKLRPLIISGVIFLLSITSLAVLAAGLMTKDTYSSYSEMAVSANEDLNDALASVSAALSEMQHEDQYVRNEALEETITKIEETYSSSVKSYESMLDAEGDGVKTDELEEQFAEILKALSEREYATAAAKLKTYRENIAAKRAELASTFSIPENVPTSNAPPSSGYARQRVETDIGAYMVSLISADLNSTRVLVDTASSSDCGNDCPVLPLGSYAARSGAFAAINGPYFCPDTYPSCAGKTNSFDMLIMNKDKHYFNSDNNVYSSVPAVIFSGNSARFVGATQQWGRDTGVDAVIANHPFLVSGGNVVFNGDGDPKKGSKGPRGFIGASGSTVYIGIVHSATVAEAAHAIKALGIQNAINLDGGGSAALWSNGKYLVGPGRNLPFGIVLVRK